MFLTIPMCCLNAVAERALMFDPNGNDFEKLGVMPQFPMDMTLLDQAYRALQMRYHPDQFLMQDAQTQQRATLYASEINDAYRRLKNPISCAEAFFAYQFDAALLQQAKGEGAFLFYILELAEQIELAEKNKDLEQLKQVSDQTKQAVQKTQQVVRAGFEQKKAIETATAIAHWKYLKKSLDNLTDKMDTLLSNL